MAEKKLPTKISSSSSSLNSSPEKKLAAVVNSTVTKMAASNFVVVTMLGLIVALSFFSGSLWARTQYSGALPVAANNANDPQALAAQEAELAKNLPEVNDSDHFRGNKDADVVMVEYSDFQCPFCERFHPTAQQLVDEYQDKVAWVYRHFPLDSIHPNARKMAQAAECAFDQGEDDAFWAYGDALFAKKPSTDEGYVEIANDLGLDSAAFSTCLGSDENKDFIQNQADGGSKAGISGTPGTFVISRKTGVIKIVKGAVSYEELKKTVDEVLAASE